MAPAKQKATAVGQSREYPTEWALYDTDDREKDQQPRLKEEENTSRLKFASPAK
jgi:hypothetical protein